MPLPAARIRAMQRPFVLVPWNADFISALADCLMQTFPGALNGSGERLVLVFPHSRPRRYLLEHLKQRTDIPKPCLVPDMYSVRELFEQVRQHMFGTRVYPGMLDKIALLRECVSDVAAHDAAHDSRWPGPARRMDDLLQEIGPTGFFPWGIRLLNLIEEFWNQGREPEDYQYMEGEVSPFAALLLANLGRIHSAYAEGFEQRGWTSPGYDALCAVRVLRDEPARDVRLFSGAQVCMAGFAGLSGAEDRLLHHLWQQGGLVCLHGDPALLNEAHGARNAHHDETRHAHWSCRMLAEWRTAWKADMTLWGEYDPSAPPPPPQLNFYEGHDLHSQLSILPELLQKNPASTPADPATAPARGFSSAVVLPDTGLLMPVLHQLPDKDVNISMGYPLERSPLARLIELLLQLRESARPLDEAACAPVDALLAPFVPLSSSRSPEVAPQTATAPFTRPYHSYGWRPFLECIRHPYLRMLGSPQNGLRTLLHGLEREVQQGGRRLVPAALAARVAAAAAESISDTENAPDTGLFFRCIQCCLEPWLAARSPAGLAGALSALCEFLLKYGGEMWERFPLDAECLFRLMQHVIPELRSCQAADTPLDYPVLFTLLRGMIAEQRVPFEADPLTGTQVLGILETRLLRFDRIILLDATDDKLPGSPAHDPLLPEGLRQLAGLPDIATRDRLMAYHLFRLAAGAVDVRILYQSGETQSGLFDAKKTPSRFIEELVWKEERTRKRLLGPDDAPRHSVPLLVRPFTSTHLVVPKNTAILRRTEAFLSHPVSPSALDTYLQCPVRFFHSRIARLAEPDSVAEGTDPAATGNLLHEVLNIFYAPRLGKPFTPDTTDIEELQALFASRLEQSELAERLPKDALIFLETAGPERLARYLRNQPQGTTPVLLEQEFTATIPGEKRNFILTGRIDRVDSRLLPETDDGPEHGAFLLDYKSGSLHLPGRSAWTDEDPWDQISAWSPDDAPQLDCLPTLAERFKSLQLPAYIYLYDATLPQIPAWDAALIDLRGNGEEMPLFGPKMDVDEHNFALQERIGSLLAFVLRHMEQSPAFLPNPGRHCDWCFCNRACLLGAKK